MPAWSAAISGVSEYRRTFLYGSENEARNERHYCLAGVVCGPIPAQYTMFRPLCPECQDEEDDLLARVRRSRCPRVRRALAIVAWMAHASRADAAVTQLLETRADHPTTDCS